MKPKIWTAILLFFSAYSPLFLILAVKDFDFENTKWFIHPVSIIVLMSLTLISIIVSIVTVKKINRGNMRVEVISINNRSVDLINYTIPYMLAFFGVNLKKIEDIIAIIIFLIIMLLLTISSKSVFINPILSLAGYGLYDFQYKFDGKCCTTIIISKYELHPGDLCYMRSLTNYLYFITKREEGKNAS